LSELVLVKEFNKGSDLGRLSELWGNLCMIQQMRGGSPWMEKYLQSGLSWSDYLTKLCSLPESNALVFIMNSVIFGFTFFTIDGDENAEVEARQQSHVANIREFYIEPGYKEKLDAEKLIQDIKEHLKKKNIEFIEFAVKDLPV